MNPENLEKRRTARFWARVDKRGDDGCWLWKASLLQTTGYGQAYWGPGRSRLAHRIAYELLVGPVPEGMQIDHLCRNRACVNPAHMEPVTQRENILRGVSPCAINARKTHCKRGHEFTPENTYVRAAGKQCRACALARGAGSGGAA